jgi:rubredoxin
MPKYTVVDGDTLLDTVLKSPELLAEMRAMYDGPPYMYSGSCPSPEHNPPGHMVFTGMVQWRCPACGRTTVLNPTVHF